MSPKPDSTLYGSSDGSVAGSHAETGGPRFLVAPATSTEQNLARLWLIPVACWRVDDVRFAFSSAFVTPDIAPDLQLLVRLRESHQDASAQYPPLSVFGHADPVGSDDYNKALSGRRAMAVYALLIANSEPGKAAAIWQQIASTESWGNPQRQAMQTTTGLPDGTAVPELIHAYVQKLCPSELALTPQDFLAQGADAKSKGDVQGCSSFNPLLVFSQDDADRYAQAQQDGDQPTLDERNSANASNRRVTVLLFRPGSVVLPGKWPCPRTSEGIAACHKRFWSDGERRRGTHLPAERRYEKSKDTFACRFYDRIFANSPCEKHIMMDDYPFST
ncbi:MAG: OmpA family protein [Bryobacteraceae bacterium]|jgi:outer membrane protein OmpA-like peptidoglycan-associated protein